LLANEGLEKVDRSIEFNQGIEVFAMLVKSLN
jgi:hypothetical protein